MIDLRVDLARIELKNPVITASGTFGNGREMAEFFDIGKLGALTTKAITLKPTEGNPYPRICETPSGIINSIGLQNQGVAHFIKEDAPFLKESGTVVIANVAGSSVDEYLEVCSKLEESGCADIFEVNISCPNVKAGGMAFGTDPNQAANLISKIKGKVSTPVFAKLTPNVGSILEIANACKLAGADGLSLINTILAMAIDTGSLKSKISSDFGGLSGPAIKPIALRMIYEVVKQIDLPIIGMGGISSTEDAVEFLAAGSEAVAVGTANLVNPTVALEIIKGLEKYLKEANLNNVNDLIGSYKGVS